MHDIRQKSLYKLRARVLAAIMVPTWFPEYDPAIHHLDHKFSVSCGHDNHVPLEIISSRHNLQLLSPEENMRKGKKCSISMGELVKAYQPHPFVAGVASMLRKMPILRLKQASIHVSRRLRRLRKARRVSFGVSDSLPPPP